MKIAKQITKRFDENDMARKKTDTGGNENLFWNRMFWLDCGVDDENSTGIIFISHKNLHGSYF